MATVVAAFLGAMASPAMADSDKDGNVITYVCRVDTLWPDGDGGTVVATACIDGRQRCNTLAGRGYCSSDMLQRGISRTCEWVALSMCRSQ